MSKKNDDWLKPNQSVEPPNVQAVRRQLSGPLGRWIRFIFFAVWIVMFMSGLVRTGLFNPPKASNTAQTPQVIDAEEQLAYEYRQRKFQKEVDDLVKSDPKSPKLYTIYGDRGYALEGQKMWAEAEKWYSKMAQVAPYAYKTYNFKNGGEFEINYASMLAAHGRINDANKVLIDTVAAMSKYRGRSDFATLQTMNALAQNYDEQKDYKKEEQVAKDMFARLKGKSKTGDDADSFLYATQRLADSYAGQKRNAEAMPLYQEAVKEFKAAGPGGSDMVQELQSKMSELK